MTFFQRVADILLVMVAAPVVLPLGLLLALLVRLSGPGPVLLKLDMMGARGRIFGQYRFRSVAIDARARQFAAQISGNSTDIADQATPIGRFMIETGLNTLPQLLNVLQGDMSLFAKDSCQPMRVRSVSSQGQ